MEIENYIKFDQIWEDIREDYLPIVTSEPGMLRDGIIEEFIKNNDLPLCIEECSVEDYKVYLVFKSEYQTATENDNYDGTYAVYIGYDFYKDEFYYSDEEK
jgi:hypothetical protein